MDFFEKAHVVKAESSRKDHKSEVAVKKQLKQILHGYKQHDSKLIRSCEDAFDPNKLLDESSSVSGFSDLNLTSSSNEADDTTRGIVGSDSEDYKTSDEEESSPLESFSSIKDTSGSIDISKISISECDDSNHSLSDNTTEQVTLDSINNTSKSSDSSLDDNTTENDFTESEFDADGALAHKIMEKLETKGVVKKRGKKRKFEAKTSDAVFKPADKQKYKEIQIEDDTETSSQSSDEHSKTGGDETIDISISDTNSSEFESIAVTNMPIQSLDDILGEYKYPTVRNIPDSQNLHSTNNSGGFTIEDLEVEDIQIQDCDNDDDNENVDPRDQSQDTFDSDEVAMATDVDTSQVTPSSMSVYDDTLNSEDTSEKEMSGESDDTNFVNPIKVYNGKSSCVFVLKHPAELYIHGKVLVTALGGAMDIFGHRLEDVQCEVYAPNYNYAFCLSTVEEENIADGKLYGKLRSEGLSIPDAEDIVTQLGEYDGIVSLKKLDKYKMDFVDNNVTPTDLFSKISRNVENCFKSASKKLGCSLYLTRPYKIFEELQCSSQVVELGLEDHSRGLLCGGKGVGKTTFLRYCVNRLLPRGPVLVIDLDPGQAEFTVAGNISATIVDQPLLGPNFTHLKTPSIMLNLGMINTMDNPRRYAAAVTALINQCHNDKQLNSMPWLINTMGMCNAMGLKFITKVILLAKPTYLVQINTRNPKKRFDTLLNPKNVMKLYEENFHHDSLFKDVSFPDNLNYCFIVENQTDSPAKNSSLAPRDERYLNFLAYFSELLNSRQKTGLLGITPYEVNLKDLNIGFNIKISANAVTKIINGKIIALCQRTAIDNVGKVFTLRDKPLLCHGHGLIRGLDAEKEILYVVTPVPVDKLAFVDTLVYADWVPELRGQEKNLPDGITIPYRANTMYQKRQLMFAPRRRFNPLQLLKMTRNT